MKQLLLGEFHVSTQKERLQRMQPLTEQGFFFLFGEQLFFMFANKNTNLLPEAPAKDLGLRSFQQFSKFLAETFIGIKKPIVGFYQTKGLTISGRSYFSTNHKSS
jgi:hypothetical protein